MSTLEENKALVKKMQKVVFGILCDIDDFCKKHNLTYYLSGGTCIGAVRHKGFIPWDDDGDIMMPRKDYMKFVKHFGKYYADKYKVGSLYTDEEWQRPFARVCDLHSCVVPTRFVEKTMGIFVDIFPIDGLPSSAKKQKCFYRKLKVLNALRNTSVRTGFKNEEGYRFIKNAAGLITRFIGPRFFAKRLDMEARKYPFQNSEEVAVSLALHYWDRETISRSLMDKAVYLPFEGRSFPVPVGYDVYLKNLYGDYMEIPSDAEENGYTHLDGWVVKFHNESDQNV